MAYECNDSTKEDRKWETWLNKCEKRVGRSLQHIEAHSDLFDYYKDGCTPDEAVDEMLMQALNEAPNWGFASTET